jgi:hypothetical protein
VDAFAKKMFKACRGLHRLGVRPRPLPASRVGYVTASTPAASPPNSLFSPPSSRYYRLKPAQTFTVTLIPADGVGKVRGLCFSSPGLQPMHRSRQ